MELSRLWVAMLTRTIGGSGTDSRIALSINAGGVERLNHTFPDTQQDDLELGQANLYAIDVAGRGIVPNELTDSSVRVNIRSTDAWRPEHFLVWGDRVSPSVSLRPSVFPIAIETGISTQLSADSQEGPSSMPLRLVSRGGRGMPINRLLMLLTTGGSTPDSGPIAEAGDTRPGSDSPLEIQVVSEGRLVVLFEIRDTSQNDLKAGGANFYTAPVITPFARANLSDGALTLRIKGRDDWEPTSFFLFGLDDAAGRPEAMVPLVHLPSWPFGRLVADPTTGVAQVTLPLQPDDTIGGEDLVVVLASMADGQRRMIRLLEALAAKSA